MGLGAMGVGVALIPFAGSLGSVVLLVGACITAGIGQGVAFRVVFNSVALKVEASMHAQIISTVYVITYLGSAVPVLGLGAAVNQWGLDISVAWFAAVIATGCLILAAAALFRLTRPQHAV